MPQDRYMRIYLNDHLAASVAGLELARRCRSSNEGTPVGRMLDGFIDDADQDQAVLRECLARVGGAPDRFKQGAAWIAEKVGRLKLNGQLTGYSPLSRLVELEGLCVGVEAKLSLWRNLKAIAGSDDRLASIDLDWLIKRAEEQRAALEEHRLAAARTAFA